MTGKITTIHIETHEVVRVRFDGALLRSWCAQCQDFTGLLRVEDAVVVGVSREAIHSTPHLHLLERANGAVFMCLNSLLK